NGTFAPGLSPAISYVDNLTLGNNAVLEMEIGGLAPGSQYDKLIDSGLLALNGTLKLILIDGYNPTAGATFDLIDWNSSIGSFANIDFSLAGLDTGLAWDTSALYTTGSVSVTAVPEPSAILLVGSVMAMTVARRRRT
ncbi:MAG: PEP-CTERM sorting domain-containing protein, partial [Planctomycetaceae bacterium]|nr:PEP-CTERM sorting domain-containing protein [Planctomycetaceae bacterium]